MVLLEADNCVYINAKSMIIVSTHVDDFLIASKKGQQLDQFKADLSDKFQMEDLGPAQYFCGVRIIRNRINRKLYLLQDTYIKKILERFGMTNCNRVTTPMEAGVMKNIVLNTGEATKEDI